MLARSSGRAVDTLASEVDTLVAATVVEEEDTAVEEGRTVADRLEEADKEEEVEVVVRISASDTAEGERRRSSHLKYSNSS